MNRPGATRGVIGLVALVVAFATAAAQPPPDRSPAPPNVGMMPPNASRVRAIVLSTSTWPPGSLSGVRPAVRPDQTLYSLTLHVSAVQSQREDLPSIALPGSTIEAFSDTPLDPGLAGTTIDATVETVGDTLGSRWMISNITPGR